MSNKIIGQLTAPGGPFELTEINVNGMDCRVFKDTPRFLPEIFSVFKQFAQRDLAVYAERRLTYQEAATQAALLAALLATRHEIKKADRVAIIMRNSPEWLIAFLAITSLGAIPVLVNSRGAPDEIAYCVLNAQCKLLITDHLTEGGLDKTDGASLARITFDISQGFTLKDGGDLRSADGVEQELQQTPSDPDETAIIMFTSGTTGRPKGALLSHRGVMTALKTNQYSSAIIGAQMAEKFGIDMATLASQSPTPCTLLMFPLFHVSGCEAVFLTTLLQGGKIVMMPRWEADKALHLIEAEKATQFPGVPAMYWDILRSPRLASFNVDSLRSLSIAGQSTPLPLFEAVKSAFPTAIIGCGYGMTETNGAVSLNIGEALLEHPTSVGQVVATSEIKLMKDAQTQATADERGEIYVRGATLMLGYDDNPEANSKSFVDGWYRTGDIGVFDEGGRLSIVDRATEMVISSGENIYCAEVERVLDQAEGVLENLTFGVADERLGERLVALVRMTPEGKKDADAIKAFTATKLASYKVPAEIVFVDQALPRTETGKALKREARKRYQALTKKGEK